MKKNLPILFLLYSLHLHAQPVWNAYQPALPEVVGTFHLRTAATDPSVAWAICAKYNVTPTSYFWQPLDSLVFTKTSDGGQTWQGGRIPMGVEPYGNSICPIDANTAWATGLDLDFASYLLQTTDGGQTWSRHLESGFTDVTSYVDFVHFFDAQHGIVMGDPAGAETEPTPFFEIYLTSDGGMSWDRVPSTNLPTALPNEVGSDHLFDARGDTIWFGTISTNDYLPLRLFRSLDRGENWTAADAVNIASFSFADGKYGVGGIQTSSATANLYLTIDGGETWTALPSLDQGNLSSLAMVPQSHYIIAVARTSNLTGPFKTLLSTDLGQTWTEIGDGSELAGNAHFTSPSIGYAGEWQPANHPTAMYSWAGDPLSGLLSGKLLPAEVETFPNPTSDFVAVQVKTQQPANFLLLVNDAQGRLVDKQVFEKTDLLNAKVDLRDLPTGTYTVMVSTAAGSLTRKILKF